MRSLSNVVVLVICSFLVLWVTDSVLASPRFQRYPGRYKFGPLPSSLDEKSGGWRPVKVEFVKVLPSSGGIRDEPPPPPRHRKKRGADGGGGGGGGGLLGGLLGGIL